MNVPSAAELHTQKQLREVNSVFTVGIWVDGRDMGIKGGQEASLPSAIVLQAIPGVRAFEEAGIQVGHSTRDLVT